MVPFTIVANALVVFAACMETCVFCAQENNARVSCAEGAIFTALEYFGCPSSITVICERLSEIPAPRDSIQAISDYVCRHTELDARVAKYPVKNIDKIRPGTIIHLGKLHEGHFVTVVGLRGSNFVIADAPLPLREVHRNVLEKQWSGYCVLIKPREAARFIFEYWFIGFLTCFLAFIVYARFWSPSRIKNTSPVLMFLGVLSFSLSAGCDARHERLSSPARVEFDKKLYSIGYVGPKGLAFDLELRNNDRTDVRIESVSTTCGCAVIVAPTFVPANSTVKVSTKLQGAVNPLQKRVGVTAKLADGSRADCIISFLAGELPCISPSQIPIKSGRGYGTIFVNSERDTEVSITFPKEFEVAIDRGKGYEVRDPRCSVKALQDGLLKIRFSITLSQELFAGCEQVHRLIVGNGDRKEVVSLRCFRASTIFLSAAPKVVSLSVADGNFCRFTLFHPSAVPINLETLTEDFHVQTATDPARNLSEVTISAKAETLTGKKTYRLIAKTEMEHVDEYIDVFVLP